MTKLDDAWKAILKQPVFAHLSTLMPDGSPQSSPVWIDVDGDQLVVNSALGRIKDKNVRRDPRVALSVTDPSNPYKVLMIRGSVEKITTEGAEAHIDAMAKRYLGQDRYPGRQPGEVRVTYHIEPESVVGRSFR